MQGAPVKQPPVTVSLKNGTTAERVVGYTEPVIRTFVPEEISEDLKHQYATNPNSKPVGVQRTEISGATCAIDTAEFSAQFQTPAIVRLPKFHGKPSKLRMTCKTPELSTQFTHTPALDGVIVGGASVAGLVAAAVTAGVAASKNNWSYSGNDINVWVNLAEK
ncbi:hypothetical protein [Pseudophaeobacter flagellatus]|uniref:hypothetical protein n=1 Tax=Pseudophaeobacter flagellatus TaxID=2899119 RepID=UPI001E2EB617|nr:hypothetical protein [Pseudophaeobacter flagellatus]MCD9146834.1 hypothetical protein [Pseudophaeobacter flagellatus]